MDDIALYYDPRNAPVAGLPPMFGMPTQAQPQQQPRVYYPTAPAVRPAAPPMALPVKSLAPAAPSGAMYYAPTPYPYGYPPAAYQQNAGGARRLWRDLSAGDLISLATQFVTAFRTLPAAPTDRGDVNTNVVNGVAFLDAAMRHFKTAAQLNAIGNVAGRLVG